MKMLSDFDISERHALVVKEVSASVKPRRGLVVRWWESTDLIVKWDDQSHSIVMPDGKLWDGRTVTGSDRPLRVLGRLDQESAERYEYSWGTARPLHRSGNRVPDLTQRLRQGANGWETLDAAVAYEVD